MAVLQPGDRVMGMRLDQGGHLTHGSPVNFSGRMYEFVAYGVDDESETLDYDVIRRAREGDRSEADRRRRDRVPARHRLRRLPVDRRRRRRAAARRRRPHRRPHRGRRASVAGAGRRHRHVHHPQDAARPAGGAILCRSELASAVDKAVFPGLQGGPLMHVIAAKAVAFHEAAQPELPRLRRGHRPQRRRARRAARRRGLAHRLGRHRQPPDARRPAPVRRHRARSRRRRSTAPVSRPTRTRSRTTPRSRSSRAACGSAPPR